MLFEFRTRLRRNVSRGAMAALLFFLCAGMVQATTVINNLPNGTNGGTDVSDTGWKAVLFTTSSVRSSINNVILGLNPNVQTDVPSSPKVEIALFQVAGGVPTAQVAATGLQTVNITALQQQYTVNVGSGFDLAPNTTYALVIRSDATKIKWGNTNPGTQPVGSNGFSYSSFKITSNSGASWTDPPGTVNAMQMNVDFVPSNVPLLDGWPLLLFAAMLAAVLFRYRRV